MPADLDRLAAEYWDYKMSQAPTNAMMLGDHRFDTEMEQLDEATELAQASRLDEFAAAAEVLDPDDLTTDQRVSRDVLMYEAGAKAAMLRHATAEFDVNPHVGFQSVLFTVVPFLPLTEPQHAEDVLVKLGKLGTTFDQAIERLRAGVAAGRTPLRSHCGMVVDQVDEYLASPIDEHDPFLRLRPPPQLDEPDAADWRARLAAVVRDVVRPAYGRFRSALADEVAPHGRPDDKPGVCWLDDGEQIYADAIYQYVTLRADPEAVHEIGVQTVAALEDEYRALGPEVVGTDDIAAIYQRMRNDPALHHSDGAAIVDHSERAMAKAKAAMGAWFGRLPQADCVVMETRNGPTAFYQRPAADGSRPGIFFVNTADPARWGTFEIEAMAYHEGIPGHHLQLAIAGELEDVPTFRKHALISAYAEGWGLYTERLADEMGLYSSPTDRMGMLSADSMRACRLVVDTGLHALGWPRQRAIDYMLAHSPLSEASVTGEVDRYIGYPGQALSYMMGRRQIVRMRRDAEAALGAAFDIKGFHDTVLGHGLVTLGVLDQLVGEWVTAAQATS